MRISLDPEDHARTTHGRPDELDLETLTGAIVGSLAQNWFGYDCSVRFRPVSE